MTNNGITNTTPIFIYSCLSDLLAFLFLFLFTNRCVFLNFMFMIPKNIKFKMVKMVKDDKIKFIAKLYIPSTPNNSNETHTFMCLGRTGRFGQF